MLFTTMPPAGQGELVPFYFDAVSAGAARSDGQCVHCVAVHYDGLYHRLLPLERRFSSWSTPAKHRDDGSIVALGPIPSELFVS